MSVDLKGIAAQVMATLRAAGVKKDLDFADQIELTAKSHAYNLLANYDWHFLRGSTSTTSVDGTATYTLTGASNDCGLIINLKYANYLMPYVPQEEFDQRTEGLTSTQQPVGMWTISSYSAAGFPIIKFFGTPSESNKTIEYRYKKRIDEADPSALLPGHMMDIIRLKCLAEFFPYPDKSAQYRAEAENKINEALWAEREKHNLTTRGVISDDRMQGNTEANRLGNRGYRAYSTE